MNLMSAGGGLVLYVSGCLKRRTLTRNTQSLPNYSFDYLRFFSEDPAMGNPVKCGINVSLLHSVLASLGLKARRIDLSNDEGFSSKLKRFLVNFLNSSTSPPFDRHSALEYFDQKLNKWVYVDIHFGYIVYPSSPLDISMADLDEPPLSAAQIQDAGDFILLVPIHDWPSLYSSAEYAKYFSQIAIGKNYDPFKKLHPLRDEFGTAYRSFCKRHRDRSTLYQWLNWEFRDSCQPSIPLLGVTGI